MTAAAFEREASRAALASARRYRDAAVRAVRIVGEGRLCFTMADVVKHLRVMSEPIALEGDAVLEARTECALQSLVGGTLIMVRRPTGNGRTVPGPILQTAVFALAHREPELQGFPTRDAERALAALRLACQVVGVSRVPTRAVTEVLRAVPALQFQFRQLTNTVLTGLAKAKIPCVEKDTAPSRGRDVMWALVPRDEPSDQLVWMRECERLVSQSGVLATTIPGTTSLHHALECLIDEAVRETKSAQFPQGRPVTISDIESLARDHATVRKHLNGITASGRTLGPALGDATKTRIAGAARARPRIVRVATPTHSQTFYDLANTPGSAERARYPDYRWVLDQTEASSIARLRGEMRVAAARVAAPTGEPDAALAHARLRAVFGVVYDLEAKCAVLLTATGAFGPTALNTLSRRHALCRDLLEQFPIDRHSLKNDGAARGGSTESLTAEDLVILAGEGLMNGLSPAEWVGRMESLPKIRNPLFGGLAAPTPRERAKYVFDPVDATVYLAERLTASSLAFFRSGSSLLGPYVRDAELLRPLLQSPRPADRSAALAALAMLGDDAARQRAAMLVRDISAREVERAEALFALLRFGAMTQEDAKHAVRGAPGSRIVRNAVVAASVALQKGRRIA